ncbi:MAG: hypothetical protein ACP5OE_08120 [Thermodesulfobium sp.]
MKVYKNIKSKAIELLIPLVVFGFLDIVVFYKLFFDMNGYLVWGNLTSLFSSKSYIYSTFSFFNPFQNNGFVLINPSANLEWVAISRVLYLFSVKFGTSFSRKLLIFGSILLLSLSFYYLVSAIVKKHISRYAATLFFVYGPFQIGLFAQGDFYYFIFQSFLLLSFSFLIRYYRGGAIKHYFFIVSLLFLFLTSAFYQQFYIGLLEYLISGVFLVWFYREKNRWKLKYALLRFFSMFLLIIPISMPIILGFIFPPISLGPSSPLAISINSFISNSLPFFKTLILESYPPNVAWNSLQQYSGFLYVVWYYAEVILIFLIVGVGILSMEKRAFSLSVAAVLSALISSESKGPFGPLMKWAYANIPGFQIMNYPYLWTWNLSLLIYGVLLALILDRPLNRINYSPISFKLFYKIKAKHLFPHNYEKIAATFIIGILIFVVASPLMTQDYYGSDAIHSPYIPPSYHELDSKLSQLGSSNYFGVAFFNPSDYIFFNNSSTDPFTNPLIYSIPVRTPAIPGYISEPLPSYNYFNWAYYKFYSNGTKYFPELMASVGYKYFVNLYNTNSADFFPLYMTRLTMNVNASQLLERQNGLVKLCDTKTYSIYSFSGDLSLVNKINSYTIFAGNYNLLSSLASTGINLMKIAPVFISDTQTQNLSTLLKNTSSIIEYNSGGITNLILSNSPNYTSIFKYEQKGVGWVNSFSELTDWYINLVAQPSPFLEASSHATINIPLTPSDAGKNVWLKVLNSDVPDNYVKLSVGNTVLKTFQTYNASLNSNTTGFTWIKTSIPKNISSNNLTIDAVGNFNGIEGYSIEPKGWLKNEISNVTTLIRKDNVLIINFGNTSAEQIFNQFITNQSLYGLVSINSTISASQTGISIYGLLHGKILVRAPYNDYERSPELYGIYPSYDSMNIILIVKGSQKNVTLDAYDVSFEVISYLVTASTLIFFIGLSMRKKRSGGDKFG